MPGRLKDAVGALTLFGSLAQQSLVNEGYSMMVERGFWPTKWFKDRDAGAGAGAGE